MISFCAEIIFQHGHTQAEMKIFLLIYMHNINHQDDEIDYRLSSNIPPQSLLLIILYIQLNATTPFQLM
jgi:hypothetical protein